MADKKPQFRSKAEEAKWKSLTNKAGHSLEQIAAGTATKSDIQNVDKTLSGMSKLAKDVFSDAVKAVEKEVEVVQKANLKKTKDDQLAFEKAVGTILKERFPELLSQIKDIIEIESLAQDDRFTTTLSSQFEAFSSFLPPKDLPTTEEVAAFHDSSVEKQSSIDDQKWELRQKQLLDTFSDRVADIFKATILSMAQAARGAASTGSTGGTNGGTSPVGSTAARLTSNVPRLTSPSGNLPTIAGRGLSMLSGSGTSQKDSDVIDVESRVIPTSGLKLSGPERAVPALPAPTRTSSVAATNTAASSTGINVSLSKAAEAAIVQAATAQTKLHEQIRDMLASTTKGGGSGGGGSGDEDDADEGKKADVWWRSFGKWVGDKYESVSDKLSTAKSWLGTLATGLISVLMAPKLYETLAAKAKELLTWDNIKAAVEKTWDTLYSSGKSVVEWVGNKLGLGKVITEAESAFGKISDAVSWVASKLGFKGSAAKPGNGHQTTSAHGTTTGGSGGGRRTPGQQSAASSTSSIAGSASSLVGSAPAAATSSAATSTLSKAAGSVPASPATANTLSKAAGSASSDLVQVGTQADGSPMYSSKEDLARGYSTSGIHFSGSTASSPRGTTTSVANNSVNLTPAVTTPVAGSVPATATNARSAAPSQSTSTVGVNSFGISSGVDDTLALMNLGVITG